MNTVQENKISMYFKLDAFFAAHLSTLAPSIPVLTSLHEQFADQLLALGTYEAEATEITTGYAVQKHIARTTMRDKSLEISGGLAALYKHQGDESLSEAARYTKSYLDAMRDTEILFKCDKLVALTNPVVTSLVNYGVTGTMIAQASNANGTFRAILESPEFQRSQGKSHGIKVDKTMNEIDHLIDIFDGLLATKASSFDIIYQEYLGNRLIDDNASGGGTPPSIITTIQPNSFLVGLTIPYQESRSFKAKCISSDSINWALSSSETAFTNPAHILNGNVPSTKLSSTLGADGDHLLFENPTANPINIEITIFD